jgi:hypothetical protein
LPSTGWHTPYANPNKTRHNGWRSFSGIVNMRDQKVEGTPSQTSKLVPDALDDQVEKINIEIASIAVDQELYLSKLKRLERLCNNHSHE